VIYIDTSCLLKVFRLEAESAAVIEAVKRESFVVVSVLVDLEVRVQLKADYLGGNLTQARWRRLEAGFSALRDQQPFSFQQLPPAVFQTALRQHRDFPNIHCRTLDRLHGAAMEELKLSRLMTLDERQAKAAVEVGFEVVRPSRS